MDTIHTTKLRIKLFGVDRIPKDATGVYPNTELVNLRNEVVCTTTVRVIKQPYIAVNAYGHKCGHRLFADCPTCGSPLPVGRLAQHHAIHEEPCSLEEAAHRAIDIHGQYDEAAERDAAFDGGEFTGPACARMADRAIQDLALKVGHTVDAIEGEANRIVHEGNTPDDEGYYLPVENESGGYMKVNKDHSSVRPADHIF